MSLGIQKRDDRPLGVAVRTYFTSPRHDDDWMEGWLELPGRDGKLLPGYGWVFGVGDGTSNVGLGILNSSKEFGKLDYKQVLREWTAGMPAEWGFTPENQVGEIRGAALPMGFNRTPHYSPGPAAAGRRRRHGVPVQRRGHLLRHGIRPLRGRVHHRRRRPVEPLAEWTHDDADAHLAGYADYVRGQWGSHFTLGRAFAALIGKPAVMKLALRTGMPHSGADEVRGAAAGQPHGSSAKGFEDRVIRRPGGAGSGHVQHLPLRRPATHPRFPQQKVRVNP